MGWGSRLLESGPASASLVYIDTAGFSGVITNGPHLPALGPPTRYVLEDPIAQPEQSARRRFDSDTACFAESARRTSESEPTLIRSTFKSTGSAQPPASSGSVGDPAPTDRAAVGRGFLKWKDSVAVFGNRLDRPASEPPERERQARDPARLSRQASARTIGGACTARGEAHGS